MQRLLFLLLSIVTMSSVELLAQTVVTPSIAKIPRHIPPLGIEIPDDYRAHIVKRLGQLQQHADRLSDSPWQPDAEMLLKAVRFAVDHGEFFNEQEFSYPTELMDIAETRLKSLDAGNAPWRHTRGLVVRGFRSRIDGSAQPYGLEIPSSLDMTQPGPLYVWLHGRGDRFTDLHFLHQRLNGLRSKFQIADAIVLHPFGRQCLGYKSAGEVDVFEAIAHVQSEYNIDPNRIVLIGFSMGGAGAWHLGAHYADVWAAVSPGAGFAETAEYNRLATSDYPVSYEQQLWGVYDVPNYVRNLFNLPVVAYSGENDGQIQAARVMERAYEQHGRQLTHLIGPQTLHKYHPETLKELLQRLDAAQRTGRQPMPHEIMLQTRTLRYSRMFWLQLLGLAQHWKDTRVDAKFHESERRVELLTNNATRLALTPPGTIVEIRIDGQTLSTTATQNVVLNREPEGKWQITDGSDRVGVVKRPGLQGPIDDLFYDSFLVVTPTGNAISSRLAAWTDFEINHLQDRWRTLFRGDLRIKSDVDVTPEDLRKHHLLLWGDPSSNRLIRDILPQLPMTWNTDVLEVNGRRFDPQTHVPAMIFPHPRSSDRYVVFNSGPTFREAHDRTNSLQNPKLPDWAVFDVRQPPDNSAAGKVVAADFFNESWQFRQ